MNYPEILEHHFLVSSTPQNPDTLIGSPIFDYRVPIAVDYTRPFIFFPRNHPVEWFFFKSDRPAVAVHVLHRDAAAAASTPLPPLAAKAILQPVDRPLFLVPVSSLWQIIPAFFENMPPVYLVGRYVPPVRLIEPPLPVLGPPLPVLASPSAYGRGPRPDRRTVYIKYVARGAPVTGEQLVHLFWQRLCNREEFIVQIQNYPHNREAFVTFSGPAAVDNMLNDIDGNEIQCEINGNYFWIYRRSFWLDTRRLRKARITFETGEAPSEEDVYSHFNRGGQQNHILESVKFEVTEAIRRVARGKRGTFPRHADLVF